jgi:hypothetical protein
MITRKGKWGEVEYTITELESFSQNTDVDIQEEYQKNINEMGFLMPNKKVTIWKKR